MSLSMFEIGIIILLVMGIAIMIASFIFSHSFQNGLLDKIIVKGMNGLEGDTVTLTCPPEMKISFTNKNSYLTRGAIISLDDSIDCDPFFQSNGQTSSFYNPSTTIDTLDSSNGFTDITGCEGQNSCSFKVPDASDSLIPSKSCLKNSKKLAFIGTFDCIKK